MLIKYDKNEEDDAPGVTKINYPILESKDETLINQRLERYPNLNELNLYFNKGYFLLNKL